MMKRFSELFVMVVVACTLGCGDDEDPAPDGDGGDGAGVVEFSALSGNWSTEDWVTGPSGNTGFLSMVFDEASASGALVALNANEWGFTCREVTVRNLVPQDADSFTSENLIRFVDGSSEWVPGEVSVDGDEIAITSMCASCANEALTLTRDTGTILSSVIIDRDIEETTTLAKLDCNDDGPDYIVTDAIDVEQPLTVEAGVVIAFEANAGLAVVDVIDDGSITAVGTSEEPILFTGLEPRSGFWRGIDVESNDVRNELNHVIVEYAGSDIIAQTGSANATGGVSVDQSSGFTSSLSVENSVFRNNTGYGLIVERGSTLRGFSNNTFDNNTEAAVLIDAENVGVLDGESNYFGSEPTGTNGLNGVEIRSFGPVHDLTADATWPALSGGAVYRVVQSIDVQARLTIEPGATIEFEANETMVFEQDFNGPNDGVLIAKGTEAANITFTGVQKTAGYWRGLVVQSNSSLNEIDHCVVEYGGSDVVADFAANIVVDRDGAFEPPDLTVTNSTIRHSAGCGIVVDSFGGDLAQSDNEFLDNAGADVCDASDL